MARAVNRWRWTVAAGAVAVALVGIGGERWAAAGDDVPLVEAGPPSVVVPLSPSRILDTRTGVGAPAGRVAPGSTLTLQVTGAGGVPSGATGVVLNLTATVADGAGYVTAYPAGAVRPDASVINYSAGADVANMVTAQLSADGALAIFNDQANVHLLADVAGYLVPGAGGGEPGPQGPQGVPGPQGPAGPGATLIRQEFVTFVDTLLTTIDGIEIRGTCTGPGANATLKVWTPGGSTMRIQGVWSYGTSSRFVNNTNDQTETETQVNEVGFSGLISRGAGGDVYQIQVGIDAANPCRALGTVIPVG